jgi:hypothetical protein
MMCNCATQMSRKRVSRIVTALSSLLIWSAASNAVPITESVEINESMSTMYKPDQFNDAEKLYRTNHGSGIQDAPQEYSALKKAKMQDLDFVEFELFARALAEHSASFRKAAENAWRAAQNGDAPYEAGFSIDKDGNPGKVQISILETVNAATHLKIASNPSSIGTLHVHNRFGEPTPSPGDIKAAKLHGEMIFVESRMGLYVVSPDGTVHHLFSRTDWFSNTGANWSRSKSGRVLKSRF